MIEDLSMSLANNKSSDPDKDVHYEKIQEDESRQLHEERERERKKERYINVF